MRDAVGVIHGRFQILHLDHMKYLLEGKKRCDYLLIGISNPDMTTIKYVCADPHRSESLANPLTYYERFWMIRGAMLESGVSAKDFDIIPFPINRAELLGNYAPKDATYYMTIYDAWGLEKKRLLEDMGCAVDVMWQRPCTQKASAARMSAISLLQTDLGHIWCRRLSIATSLRIASMCVCGRCTSQTTIRLPSA